MEATLKPRVAAAMATLVVALVPMTLAHGERHDRDEERSPKTLYVWAGDQARVAPDFLAVIDFDEDSPRRLISELLPDVLVKGGDYALDEIHGREEVERAGGRVLALPFVEGASTTGIIERVKGVNREP